jgi:phage baseplate assembly protein W
MIGMDALTGKQLSGAEHLAQSVGKILGTPLGTRVGRRDFGSRLPELLDQPLNARTRVLIYAATADALRRHEPRIALSRVTFVAGEQSGSAVLTLQGTRTDVAAAASSLLSLTVPVRAA